MHDSLAWGFQQAAIDVFLFPAEAKRESVELLERHFNATATHTYEERSNKGTNAGKKQYGAPALQD